MKKLSIFSFEKSYITFSIEFTDINIKDLKFHPIYYNILAITSQSSVLLYNIEEKNFEKKVEFKDSSNIMLKTEFNPCFKNILATLSQSDIKIWDINNYYYLYNINLNGKLAKKISWSNDGNYLIYKKNVSTIEIFCLKKKMITHHLEKVLDDFYLLEENGKILCLTIKSTKNIILFDLKSKNEILTIKLPYYYFTNSILDKTQYLLYIFFPYQLIIYDIKKGKQIYLLEINLCNDFILLKDIYNKQNLFGKFIVYSSNPGKKSGFKLYEFFSKEYTENKIIRKNVVKKALFDFWEKSLDIIEISYDNLSFKNNSFEKDEIKVKSYLSENTIIEKNKNLMANYTLKQKRNMVIEGLNNFKENADLREAYIKLIVELMKDNTNSNLLIKYLKFLNKNERKLEEYFTIETYINEINYYQICFTKELLKKELNFTKNESEKEKFYKLLKEISELNEGELGSFLEIKQEEYKHLPTFNQPISFENKELLYFRNRAIILFALNKFLEKNNYQKINKMRYCVKEILKRNLFENKNIINKKEKFTFLIILIAVPQREIITNYNLNLIEDESNISENELKQLGFKFEENSNKIKYKDNKIELVLNLENIESINNKNLHLSIQAGIKFYECELYKYEQIIQYYKGNIYEINIRKFLSKILCSNVMKESFSFFYGTEIKYPFTNIKDAENFVDEYFQFIPLKSETTLAVTDKYTMEIYTFLSNKSMSFNFDEIKINEISKNNIEKTLLNGAIIVINYHEINHDFHNYFFYSKNGEESFITPRKLNMKEREGGKNMERILFGNVLNSLNYKQALYILNETNYNKSLKEFQADFIKLKMKDIKLDGIFSGYSEIDKEVKDISDYMAIKLKEYNYNIEDIKININLKDDVLGFPRSEE